MMTCDCPARSGRLTPRDIVLTLCFLGLCHSLIEDTLLIMLIVGLVKRAGRAVSRDI